ncbi:hypothetical protein MtrunA17_Chr8g0348051 [Medicago truncatula]|uniref:Uncharacterized protein n=1 Tax=Medicago truncatula TaxID=3880 RepID=A0A396GHE7_MEDTR|nr:hypothetical protein MtrunA17_Chr8g0348051 [Medicago truncatula]
MLRAAQWTSCVPPRTRVLQFKSRLLNLSLIAFHILHHVSKRRLRCYQLCKSDLASYSRYHHTLPYFHIFFSPQSYIDLNVKVLISFTDLFPLNHHNKEELPPHRKYLFATHCCLLCEHLPC